MHVTLASYSCRLTVPLLPLLTAVSTLQITASWLLLNRMEV